MKADWHPLRAALAEFRAASIPLPIWWRDDDATAPTAAFDQLVSLAQDVAVPVHAAIIPADATAALAREVIQNGYVLPLVHGWAHVSHAPAGEKNAEFGHPRQAAAAEIEHAMKTMRGLFGDSLLPVFVPPWNRIAPDHFKALAEAGYTVLSTYGPRQSQHAAPGLVQVNTHIDPIDWRGTRDLVVPDVIIARVCDTLGQRLRGAQDNSEPLGLLTHHLVHSDAIWAFCEQLLRELLDGGAVPHPLKPLMEPPS